MPHLSLSLPTLSHATRLSHTAQERGSKRDGTALRVVAPLCNINLSLISSTPPLLGTYRAQELCIYSTRSKLKADTDHTSFIAGTLNLKEENESSECGTWGLELPFLSASVPELYGQLNSPQLERMGCCASQSRSSGGGGRSGRGGGYGAGAAVTVVVDMAVATVVAVTAGTGVEAVMVHATLGEAALPMEAGGIRVRFLSVGASYFELSLGSNLSI
ncbi:hypothetical protein Acr_10g0002600 [Actinidia rufa]|uniref:Uncharacterized protein n=1 Tax=Actinidia rufa TaxID=165716 RepID=A0A7J0F866_9ERIC|nr:hypothetical protein Acr_10g0002600 [Actinidia rufa]